MEVHVNLSVFSGRLSSELDGNLLALKATLKAIDEGTHATSPFAGTGVIKMAMSVPDASQLKKQEINKCFKSSVGALQDFMDSLIAIRRMAENKIQIDVPIADQEGLQAFLKAAEDRAIQEVSRDRKLTVPRKLDILQIDEPIIRTIVDGYFAARNSLEHHKGIADRDIDLTYRELIALAGKDEVTELGVPIKENTALTIGIHDVARTIAENSKIEITEIEIENILQTIKVFINITMTEKLLAFLREPKT